MLKIGELKQPELMHVCLVVGTGTQFFRHPLLVNYPAASSVYGFFVSLSACTCRQCWNWPKRTGGGGSAAEMF